MAARDEAGQRRFDEATARASRMILAMRDGDERAYEAGGQELQGGPQQRRLELGVPDVDRALAFFGWSVDPAAKTTQIDTPTLSIGIHGRDPEPHFEVFAVPDLDTALAAVTDAGGAVVSPATDSPGFGRWAECRDDQGMRFGLRQPS